VSRKGGTLAPVGATIQGWKLLLQEEKYKAIIIDALNFLVETKKVKVNAFVIMDNHIHLIWQALRGYTLAQAQTSFKKHTSKQFLKRLEADKYIEKYEVNSPDRKHYFWKRNSLGIELFTESAFLQKLNYIHNNPVVAGFCGYAEDYKFSSAGFYLTGNSEFDFLEHYMG
jgi:REP element-mobilizing transposase RayT